MSEEKDGFVRKPIAHFFVKRELQMGLIIKVVSAVLLTTLISLGTVFLVYYFKFDTVVMYRLDKITLDLKSDSILSLILPTLIFSAIVNIIVAIGIGFYTSRKYAIPVYKLEQWCKLQLQGRMSALLHFREGDELNDLTHKCNELARFYQERFVKIKQQAEELKAKHPDAAPVKAIEEALAGLDLSADLINVNTSYCTIALSRETDKK
ncbi:MAG: hypothetical protein MUF22_00455 [Chitinispirillaceae bacterium]|jgi:hypothetical protein|nr:hypothetical protein [Chitinispirillaceae bacterium]